VIAKALFRCRQLGTSPFLVAINSTDAPLRAPANFPVYGSGYPAEWSTATGTVISLTGDLGSDRGDEESKILIH
jgi:hypothetical protein